MKNKAKGYYSISKRLPLLISLSFLILLIIAVLITFLRVEDRMKTEYRRMADGVTNLMIEQLDTDKMDMYIEENYSSEEYVDIIKQYYKLKDNYPDVYYMYVYRFYKDGDTPTGTIIFDLDEEYPQDDAALQESIDLVGTKYIVLEPFASRIDEMTESHEPIFDTAYSEEDGYLLSFAKPIFDEDGNYVASACVDFSMQQLHRQNVNFIIILGAILVVISIILLIISVIGIKHMVTKPLLTISKTVSDFKYENDSDRTSNLEKLRKLSILPKNEISVLYNALLEAEKDSAFYMTSYLKAEDELHVKDERINKLGILALRDEMTSVGNKAAFSHQISIIRDNEEYGIVLMDANDLKMINDKYGHTAGDEYIKGCCKILCEVYECSPVFRIGGDEFAVLLKGRDYEHRHELLTKIKDIFEKIREDDSIEPAKKYSGSVGMADSTTCKTTRETIRTADENMYEDKKQYKERYGSYR
ncbi:MAG: GGDEF domain-containing protein [Ruminococcus sp.]|nr:GGDEF domain-containing protein [Ruminococcus sp.]